MPNINELKSLLNAYVPNSGSWLNAQGFTNAQSSWYWSSSTYTYAYWTHGAWFFDMSYGFVNGAGKTGSLYVWPVRGGQSGSLCNLAISPSSQTFTSSGGTGSVTVTASGSSCAWTASSSLSWATITSGASGTGSGTVTISVSANATGASRTGNITIAGQTFMVTQASNTTAVTCNATLSADLATINVPIIKYSSATGNVYISADLVYNSSQNGRIKFQLKNVVSVDAASYANCQMATRSSVGPNNQYTGLFIPTVVLNNSSLGGMALDYDDTTGLYTVMALGL